MLDKLRLMIARSIGNSQDLSWFHTRHEKHQHQICPFKRWLMQQQGSVHGIQTRPQHHFSKLSPGHHILIYWDNTYFGLALGLVIFVSGGAAGAAGSTAAAGSHWSSGAQGKDPDRLWSCFLGVLEGEGAGLCEELSGWGLGWKEPLVNVAS